MAAPWEAYQTSATSDGPWSKYSAVAARFPSDEESLKAAPVSAVEDVAKSGGIGLAKGLVDAVGTGGDARHLASAGVDWAANKIGINPDSVTSAKNSIYDVAKHVPILNAFTGPDSDQVQKAVEGVTGEFYKPQTTAGRYVQSVGEAVGNPVNYVGPGGIALKAGGAAASALGSEAGKDLTKGTDYERAGQLAGALIGGGAAAKTLAPKLEKAAIPTAEELKASANKGYDAARNSGVELDPAKFGTFAAGLQNELTNGPKYAFTGGSVGTAPKTIAAIESLQSAPAGGKVLAPNLDALRIHLNNIAGETNGFKPTADAKAAMVAKQRLAEYLTSVPTDHIVAGDADAYLRNTKQANGDWAAASRAQTVDGKITRAENNAEGGIATSIDNQIKSQVRTILNNPKAQRGFSKDEVGAMKDVNKGTLLGNTLRQLGRGGTGVIPMMMHGATVAATGGASLIPQAALAAGLYASKKTAEGMTKRQATKLDEMIRMRSPEYDARKAAMPPTKYDPANTKGALARALLQVR